MQCLLLILIAIAVFMKLTERKEDFFDTKDTIE